MNTTAASPAQWDDQKAEARAIICLLRDRVEAERVRGGRSTLLALQSSHLGMIPAPDFGRYAVPSPRLAWILSVGCVLNSLGREAAYILLARLGRRPKSLDHSWSQILSEMDDLGMGKAEHEAKAIFRKAVPIFLLLLEVNGITRDYRDTMVA